MGDEVHLQLLEEGADDARLAALTGYLKSELLRLDVDDVRALPGGTPAPGARALGGVTVGALVIALGQSAEGLRSVVAVIRNWLQRGEGKGRTVRLELDDDVLELSEATPAEQEQLIELFVRRHALGSASP